MGPRLRSCAALALGLVPACGGDKARDSQGGEADGGIMTAESGEGTAASSAGSGGQDEGNSGTSAGSSAEGTASADDDGGGTGALPKYDVGTMPDVSGAMPCGEGSGDPEFSFLWASNSSQGTISKIDTQTVQEMGRYIVRPDSAGSPSRTSVNLAGDVAVANRNGGVTKIYAIEERCDDANGNGSIETSSGAADILPWGSDECIAWHTPYASQRPVAWTQGTFNEGTCEYEDAKLWTSGSNGPIDVILMDGDTGAVLDMVNVPGLNQDFYGIYGGAVDGEGNFWGTQLGSGSWLVRVDIDDLTYTIYDPPNGPHWYGMTVDSDGYVWMCSSTAARFDPMTETFQTNVVGGWTGCMAEAGADGLLWMANGSGVVGVNRETLQVEVTWPTPGSYGISIDYYGFVWAVASGSSAHRVDPDTGQVTSYNGLVGAYTYSDMTGYALTHAGGGAPSG
jgi:hypothetical protein